MTTEQLILCCYAMPKITLDGGGSHVDYDFSAEPPFAYVLQHRGQIVGLSTEYEAAIGHGERLAALSGWQLIDRVVETIPGCHVVDWRPPD